MLTCKLCEACYHSVQSLLSFSLIFTNITILILIYNIIISLLFCLGVKLGSLQCGRNRMLRGIFVSKRDVVRGDGKDYI